MRKWATLTQIATTFERLGYKPLHLTDFHLDRRRVKLLAGGEGTGKSLGAAMDTPVGDFPFWKLGYIVGPKYEQSHKEFRYLFEALTLLNATSRQLCAMPDKGQWHMRTLLGQDVYTLSADDGENVLTGTGESPDWVLLVECGKLPYSIYLAARGRVARSRGKLTLSGTIEESERWYPELITRWQTDNPEGAKSYIIPTWENRVLYPLGFKDPEIIALANAYQCDISNGIPEPTEGVNDQNQFWERFGARPVVPSTIVLKEFSYTRNVKHAPYWVGDKEWKELPVEVWVDPGGDGHYAVLAVQVNGHKVWVIDEVCVEYGLASDIIGICEKRAWWENVPKIGNMKGAIGGVMDIAGKSRDGRESHEDIWKREARIAFGAKRVSVDDGIQRHRSFLKNTFTGEADLLHDPRCKYTLKEYGEYKRNKDTGAVIDKDNHAMKALAYGLVYHFGVAEHTQQQIPNRERAAVIEVGASMFR